MLKSVTSPVEASPGPKPPKGPRHRRHEPATFQITQTGAELGLPLAELVAKAQNFLQIGNFNDAFLCAARAVREDAVNMAACKLLVDIYHRLTGYSGDVTAAALHRRLAPDEIIVRVADRRLFVVAYLRGLPANELRAGHVRNIWPSAQLIGGQVDFRVFATLEEACTAAGLTPYKKPAPVVLPKPLPPTVPMLSANIQVEKSALLVSAQAAYDSQRFSEAAAIYDQIAKLDPNDLLPFCYYFLSSLREMFPLINKIWAGHSPSLHAFIPVSRPARRLEQRIMIIRFLRAKAQAEITSTQIRLNPQYRRIAGLLFGDKKFRAFEGFAEAKLAAGRTYNESSLAKLKRKIETEARLALSFRRIGA